LRGFGDTSDWGLVLFIAIHVLPRFAGLQGAPTPCLGRSAGSPKADLVGAAVGPAAVALVFHFRADVFGVASA
jgi:hypothetical protein